MADAYLVFFFVGLFFTVVSAILSGALGGGHDFGHAEGVDLDGAEAEISHEFDMGHDFDHSVAEAGGDGHVEVGASDAFPGLSAWSPTVLATFVTTFGGAGYLTLTEWDAGVPGSLAAGLAAGLAIGLLVFWGLNKVFAAVQSSSEVSVAALVGEKAEVISPIPAGGVGEIAYVAGGTRLSAPARTLDGEPLARATRVRIVRIAGSDYYVKPF